MFFDKGRSRYLPPAYWGRRSKFHFGLGEEAEAPPEGYDFTVTITATRSSGTVPCGVQFSVLTTTGQTGSLMHDCMWVWNLGGDLHEDVCFGFRACAVYTTTGTKTVTCTGYDSAGNVGFGEFTFTVNAFTGTDYYVRTDGSNANDGLSSGTGGAWQNIAHAMTQLASSYNWRLNLQGGQTHTQTAAWTAPDSGTEFFHWRSTPSTGTATISCTTVGMVWVASNGSAEIAMSDITINGPNSGTGSRFLDHPNNHPHLTIAGGVSATGWATCLHDGTRNSSVGNEYISGLTYTQTSAIGDSYYGCGILNYGLNQTLNIVNSTFDMGSGVTQHNLRAAYLFNSSFRDVSFVGSTGNGHALKLTGEIETGSIAGLKSCSWVNITATNTQSRPVAIEPENVDLDQWIEDQVFINLFVDTTSTGTGSAVRIQGLRITFFNCRIGAGPQISFDVSHQSTLTTNRVGDIKVIGCSNWNGSAFDDHTFFNAQSNGAGRIPFGLVVKNCARYYPAGGTTSRFIGLDSGIPLSNLTDSDNVDKIATANASDATYIYHGGTEYQFNAPPGGHGSGIIYDNPDFVSSSDLHLQAGSPCIGAGVAIGGLTKFDADGVDRGAEIDIGAYERV